MRVRLTQIDGKLPNLALMKLAHWHRAHGDEIVFQRWAIRKAYTFIPFEDYDVNAKGRGAVGQLGSGLS